MLWTLGFETVQTWMSWGQPTYICSGEDEFRNKMSWRDCKKYLTTPWLIDVYFCIQNVLAWFDEESFF